LALDRAALEPAAASDEQDTEHSQDSEADFRGRTPVLMDVNANGIAAISIASPAPGEGTEG
jgi:hypothetical protein